MKTPVHILQKIAQNRTTQAKILDLRNQALLEIPPEVFELTHLSASINRKSIAAFYFMLLKLKH